MNTSVALVIIYNHKYINNIEILERIYCKRFSKIFHLMPFYDGYKSNVISVYGSSFYFQGYIAQGAAQFLEDDTSHYFFIADDLLLNPAINETNYTEHFNLKEASSFLPEFINLHEVGASNYLLHVHLQRGWWPRVPEAYHYNPKKEGVKVEKELPSYKNALENFKKFNLVLKPLKFDQIWKTPRRRHAFSFLRYLFQKLGSKLSKRQYKLLYPLVGSYSDICIVSSKNIRRFCHYCGVFAATDLFVELALPTALILSAEDIVTEKDLQLHGKAMWTIQDYEEILKYNNKLRLLLSDFPENYIYLHPIKLSKWDTKI